MELQAGQSGPSQAKRRPKKKISFLSILNCCSVPDDASTVDESRLPTKKINKIDPQARPTTSSKPNVAGLQTEASPPSAPVPEKESAGPSSTKEVAEPPVQPEPKPNVTKTETVVPPEQAQTVASAAAADAAKAHGKEVGYLSAPDLSAPAVSPPAVLVETPLEPIQPNDTPNPPQQIEQEKAPAETMPHVTPVPEPSSTAAEAQLLPPPPARDESEQPLQKSSEPIAEPAEDKQQWLLPPIAPQFKGKKCLVLDLDETLVHSSFKVGISAHYQKDY